MRIMVSYGITLLLFISLSPTTCITTNELKPDRFTNATLQMGLQLCGFRHFCFAEVSGPVNWIYPCCMSCYCDDACWAIGDCCPDAPEPSTRPKYVNVPRDCVSNVLPFGNADVKEKEEDVYVSMITRCPEGYTDEEVRTKCEAPYEKDFVPFMNSSLDDYVPVFDRNKTAFRNIYCAECHHAGDVKKWHVLAGLTVKSWDPISSRSDFEASLRQSKFVVWPDAGSNIKRHMCRPTEPSSCRDGTSEELLQACRFSKFLASPTGTDKNASWFRNPFCFLCDLFDGVDDNAKYDVAVETVCKVDVRSIQPASYGNFLRLDFDVKDDSQIPSIAEKSCADDSVYDVMHGICRQIHCPLVQRAVNGECVRAGSDYLGIAIRFTVRLEITPGDIGSYSMWTQNHFANDAKIHSGIFDRCQLCGSTVSNIDNVIEYTFLHWSVSLSSECTFEQLSNMLLSRISKQNNLSISLEEGVLKMQFLPVVKGQFVMLNGTITDSCTSIDIDRLFHCGSVILNESEYCIWEQRLSVPDMHTCNLNGHDGGRPDVIRYISQKGQPLFKLCFKTYRQFSQTQSNVSNVFLQGVVSLVCTCISMSCTAGTILIIGCTTKVQFNMMILLVTGMANLFVAQGLFQFTTDLPRATILCSMCGLLSHYFWLATTFALNCYCCNVLYTVKTSVKDILSRRRMVLSYGYIFLGPIIFILANFIYTSLYIPNSNDSEVHGYGDQVCFINTPLMRGLTFAAPILISVLFNCTVYIAIVTTLGKQTAENRRSGIDTNYAAVYFRLLSITGVTWLIGLANEIVPSPVLEYMFIICFGSQGVFLFMSFGPISLKRRKSARSTSSRTTSD